MDRKILVTGATGCVGHYIVRLLSEGGISIRAAVHSPQMDERLHLPGVEQVHMDYLDIESVREGMNGIQRLYLITPAAEHMADMTRNLVNEAKRAGVELIVKQSALGADGANPSLLGRRHRHAEQLVEWSGISYTTLRSNAFMQNWLTAHGRDIRERDEFYCPSASGSMSMIDARDVAAAGVEALTSDKHANQAFTITGPVALTHAEMAEILSKAVGRQISFKEVGETAARQAMLQAGVSPWFTEAMIDHYQAVQSGERSIVTDGFEKLMHRKPGTFEKFVNDYAGHFMSEKKDRPRKGPAEEEDANG